MNRLLLSSLLNVIVVSAAQTETAQAEKGPNGFGGGDYKIQEHGPHLTSAQRKEINRQINENVGRLQFQGKLLPAIAAPISMHWPLKLVDGLEDFSYYGVSNFVDQDNNIPSLLDYYCGARTYDVPGYNHSGTDIFLWPFPWNKMDNSEVEIIAAAPGVIVLKDDGNYDRNCGFGADSWNAVYVQHADGSTVWYGHMKNGSLTDKSVGDTVITGDYLGIVGSSGNSTSPHLHLELFDNQNNLIDPYSGICNSLNVDSWWDQQKPYYEPTVNKLTTGHAPADHGSCPTPESPNERKTFSPGDAIYFTAYYHDQLNTSASQYSILKPDQSVYQTWNHTSNSPHYVASWWYWNWTDFASGGPEGIWKFTLDYESKHYEQRFYLVNNCTQNLNLNNQTIPDTQVLAASDSIQTGSAFTIADTGFATILAQNAVSFGPGFSVKTGGKLLVELTPGVCD